MIAVNTGLGKTESWWVCGWEGAHRCQKLRRVVAGKGGKRGWQCRNCKPEPPRPEPRKGRAPATSQHLDNWAGLHLPPRMCFLSTFKGTVPRLCLVEYPANSTDAGTPGFTFFAWTATLTPPNHLAQRDPGSTLQPVDAGEGKPRVLTLIVHIAQQSLRPRAGS